MRLGGPRVPDEETSFSHTVTPAVFGNPSASDWINSFHNYALNRNANTVEFNYWEGAARRARTHVANSLAFQAIAREMGRKVFDSAEYQSQSPYPSNSEYVLDLYAAYLFRTPTSNPPVTTAEVNY